MGKWLDKFVNASIGAQVADAPAVMTASGWQLDNNGNWHQQQTKETDKLAKNLAIIGGAGAAAMTAPYWAPAVESQALWMAKNPLEAFVAPAVIDRATQGSINAYELLSGNKVSDGTRRLASVGTSVLGSNILGSGIRKTLGILEGKFLTNGVNQLPSKLQNYLRDAVGYNAQNALSLQLLPSISAVPVAEAQTAIENKLFGDKSLGQSISDNPYISGAIDFTTGSLYSRGINSGARYSGKVLSNLSQLSNGAATSDVALINASRNISEAFSAMLRPAGHKKTFSKNEITQATQKALFKEFINSRPEFKSSEPVDPFISSIIKQKLKGGIKGINLSDEEIDQLLPRIMPELNKYLRLSQQATFGERESPTLFRDGENISQQEQQQLLLATINKFKSFLNTEFGRYLKENKFIVEAIDQSIPENATYQQLYDLSRSQMLYNIVLHSYNTKLGSGLEFYNETAPNKNLQIGDKMSNGLLKVIGRFSFGAKPGSKDITEVALAKGLVQPGNVSQSTAFRRGTTGYSSRYFSGENVNVVLATNSDKLPPLSEMKGWKMSSDQQKFVDFDINRLFFTSGMNDFDLGPSYTNPEKHTFFNANGHGQMYLLSPTGEKYIVAIDASGAGSAGDGGIATLMAGLGQQPTLTMSVKKVNDIIPSKKTQDKFGHQITKGTLLPMFIENATRGRLFNGYTLAHFQNVNKRRYLNTDPVGNVIREWSYAKVKPSSNPSKQFDYNKGLRVRPSSKRTNTKALEIDNRKELALKKYRDVQARKSIGEDKQLEIQFKQGGKFNYLNYFK